MTHITRMSATAVFTAVALHLPVAQAALVISNQPTKDATCSAGTCKPTKKDAVLNAGQVLAQLAAGNLIVTTTGGTDTSQATNLQIEAALRWQSSSTLTLEGIGVQINNQIAVAGTGGLTVPPGSTGLSFGPKGRVRFASKTSRLVLGYEQYTLVGSIADIAATERRMHYLALMDDYDASGDGTYTASPISRGLYGFEGLNNYIANVTIDARKARSPRPIGLFAFSGAIENLHVRNIHITANAHSGAFVGGLVGQSSSGLIYDTVTGTIDASGLTAGGLAGQAGSAVYGSTANVRVKGGVAGGLVGSLVSSGSVTLSSASGSVSAKTMAGGLVGQMLGGMIQQSFATGAVKGDRHTQAGGLVGSMTDYGNGNTVATIQNSYAFGAVTAGGGPLGGLVGELDEGQTATAYSIGTAAGPTVRPRPATSGGLIGQNLNGLNSDDYWDRTTSEDNNGTGSGSQSGMLGRTTTQLKAGLPKGFSTGVWAEDPMINNGYPYLIANPPQ